MNAEELIEELRYAVGMIQKYISDYTERSKRESKETSRSYDQGVVHGCYHALSYIMRFTTDEKEYDPDDLDDQDLGILTLADYDEE